MKKYDVCLYTFDWETIESFTTFEEAKKFADELFEKQKLNYAIFHGDDFITEYRP